MDKSDYNKALKHAINVKSAGKEISDKLILDYELNKERSKERLNIGSEVDNIVKIGNDLYNKIKELDDKRDLTTMAIVSFLESSADSNINYLEIVSPERNRNIIQDIALSLACENGIIAGIAEARLKDIEKQDKKETK